MFVRVRFVLPERKTCFLPSSMWQKNSKVRKVFTVGFAGRSVAFTFSVAPDFAKTKKIKIVKI